MTKNLVIVESPAKAKTISKFLGKDYDVVASMGHVRDLPNTVKELTPTQKKLPYASLGVDTEDDFKPLYIVSSDKKKVIKDLKDRLKKTSGSLYIATDEDREGEAIGWHLLETLKPGKDTPIKRIVFHEITKEAILHALETPRAIDQALVNAQQSRRILDRLVGYRLSPLLWTKIRTGLSAGRVQSVAVRLVVDREREIQAFNAEEYWTLKGIFQTTAKEIIEAGLHSIDQKKVELHVEGDVKQILDNIEKSAFSVTKVTKKQTKKNPAAPFITSTLQQEAYRKLGFSVKKTMMLAQRLYEGIEIGKEGSSGLITYMRTDSVHLSDKALKDSKAVITELYGKEYALSEPRAFKKKAKGAQEAHEAIRPTEFYRKPGDIEKYLEKDEFRLYELIWKRALASQMEQALMNNVSVDISGEGVDKKLYTFRATGQTIAFPGFMKVYTEGADDPDKLLEDKERILPEVEEKDAMKVKEFLPEQHFTKPPPRYTEASLVKKMEEEGIGRPSTYAPTITTIINRGYIVKEEKKLAPTDVAFVVTDFLVGHFSNIADLKFTANMEESLDDIAEGKIEWIPFLHEFYDPFDKLVIEKKESVKREDIITEKTDEVCKECGKPMVIKLSRAGKFLSCSDYPTCKFAKPLVTPEQEEKLEQLKDEYKDEKCEKCGSQMVVKTGRFGQFLACSHYPECKTTKAIQKTMGITCPDCKEGELVERKTRKGRTFFGCNKYPKCKFASWKQPLPEKCPSCQGMLVLQKAGLTKCLTCEEEFALDVIQKSAE